VPSSKRAFTAVIMLLAVLAGCDSHPHQAPRASQPPASGQAGLRTVAPGPATFSGPDGVEARWVIEENDKPGTTAWKIHGSHGGISGFAGQVYARPGQQVTLYVSTTGPTFRALVFRMGYYQGQGARLIWTSPVQAGKDQPACPVTSGVNMVSCGNWSPSLTFTVTPAFVQGDYLIKLTGPGNRQSYVPLTISDPASTATYVIKNDVFTWQAWNYYGGYDYYQGLGSCPPDVYPVCNRARVVSYDRPYAAENGSGNFLGRHQQLDPRPGRPQRLPSGRHLRGRHGPADHRQHPAALRPGPRRETPAVRPQLATGYRPVTVPGKVPRPARVHHFCPERRRRVPRRRPCAPAGLTPGRTRCR
jgi:hypothetical protein